MKSQMRTFATVALLLALAITGMAQDPKALAPKGDAAVIAAPKEGRLTWENHRLRAANIRMQLEALNKQAESEDKAAEAELDVMQKAVGDKYAPRINPQTGQLEFFLKAPDPKDAPKDAPKDTPKDNKKP